MVSVCLTLLYYKNRKLFRIHMDITYSTYHILEGLRLRLTDRFLKAPLGDVEGHSIGEIKSIMVEKIENMEPPIAHMIRKEADISCFR